MRVLAGADAQIHFTNLSTRSSEYLDARFATMSTDGDAAVRCHNSGIMELIGHPPFETGIDKVCLLDPKAASPLSPQDGDGQFSCFLFGVGPSCSHGTRQTSFHFICSHQGILGQWVSSSHSRIANTSLYYRGRPSTGQDRRTTHPGVPISTSRPRTDDD
jgi:hypothetical protein